jgi:hypothetical protein
VTVYDGPQAGSALAVRVGRAEVPCLRPRGLGARGAVAPSGPRAPLNLQLSWDARAAWRVPVLVVALEDGGDVLGTDAVKVQVKTAGKFTPGRSG